MYKDPFTDSLIDNFLWLFFFYLKKQQDISYLVCILGAEDFSFIHINLLPRRVTVVLGD